MLPTSVIYPDRAFPSSAAERCAGTPITAYFSNCSARALPYSPLDACLTSHVLLAYDVDRKLTALLVLFPIHRFGVFLDAMFDVAAQARALASPRREAL